MRKQTLISSTHFFFVVFLTHFFNQKLAYNQSMFHGLRMQESSSRPLAPLLKPDEQKADELLLGILGEDPPPDWPTLEKHRAHLEKFPAVIQYRKATLLNTIENIKRGHQDKEAFCLELLSNLTDPELIPLFEIYLEEFDRDGRIRFPAARGLGLVYKNYPDLLTKEREDFLFNILKAKDRNDLGRLYLRQHLPHSIMKDLDERVYHWNKATRPKNAAQKLIHRTKKDANQVTHQIQASIARRALAFQTLLRLEPVQAPFATRLNRFFSDILAHASSKPEKLSLDESLMTNGNAEQLKLFWERVSAQPRGLGLNVHDGIQLANLLQLLRRKGIALEKNQEKSLQDLIHSQFRTVWNSSNFLVRYNRDSNLSSYAHSAMLLSQQEQDLSPTLDEALTQLKQLRGEINPRTRMPQINNYTSETHRHDATIASSAGRALTNQLVFYRHADSEKKAAEAVDLLSKLQAFDRHFSQLFEWDNHTRSHDRHPRGEGMAVYYGYGNVPYAAEALVSLNREKLFNLDQKNEVRTLALRLKNRILNLMRFEDRVVDNIDYNNLALIALQTIQDEFNLPE